MPEEAGSPRARSVQEGQLLRGVLRDRGQWSAGQDRRGERGGPAGGAGPDVLVVTTGGVDTGDEAGPVGRAEGPPRGREVVGRVARGQVAEVDEAGEPVLARHHVPGVRVAVQPPRRAGPRRSRERRLPDAEQRVRRPVMDEHACAHHLVPVRERHAAEQVGRRVAGRRSVQREQRVGKVVDEVRAPVDRQVGHDDAVDPLGDDPRPGVVVGRYADEQRHRGAHREGRGDLGEPARLVLDERGALLAQRQAQHEPLAEPDDDVVPAAVDLAQLGGGARRVPRHDLVVDQTSRERQVDDHPAGVQAGRSQRAPSGGTRTVAENGRPCHGTSSACTAPDVADARSRRRPRRRC